MCGYNVIPIPPHGWTEIAIQPRANTMQATIPVGAAFCPDVSEWPIVVLRWECEYPTDECCRGSRDIQERTRELAVAR